MIRRGVILVFIGMFFVIKIILLYLFIFLVKVKLKFVNNGVVIFGNIILKNVVILLVLSIIVVFLYWLFRFFNIGWIVFIIKGIFINVNVIIIFKIEKEDFILIE